jgi:hypothetical protein
MAKTIVWQRKEKRGLEFQVLLALESEQVGKILRRGLAIFKKIVPVTNL